MSRTSNCVAHVDETGVRLADGDRLYGMAAVLTDDLVHPEITVQLQSLVLPGKKFLHHYDETARAIRLLTHPDGFGMSHAGSP